MTWRVVVQPWSGGWLTAIAAVEASTDANQAWTDANQASTDAVERTGRCAVSLAEVIEASIGSDEVWRAGSIASGEPDQPWTEPVEAWGGSFEAWSEAFQASSKAPRIGPTEPKLSASSNLRSEVLIRGPTCMTRLPAVVMGRRCSWPL